MQLEEFVIKKTAEEIKPEDFSSVFKSLKEELAELDKNLSSLREDEEADAETKAEAMKFMKLANKYFGAVDGIETDLIRGKRITDEIEGVEITSDEEANEIKREYLRIAREFSKKAKEKWLQLMGKKS